MVPMRDGVALATNLYTADADAEARPVLLIRTPYCKDAPLMFAPEVLDRGYVVVAQDVRGRYRSQGDFDLLAAVEVEDGADTIAWIRRQPFSNGRVGMFGSSYLAFVQYFAARARPEGLAAILPLIGSPTVMRLFPGVPSLEMTLIFATYLLADYTARNHIRIEDNPLRQIVASVEKMGQELTIELIEEAESTAPDIGRIEELTGQVASIRESIREWFEAGSLREKCAELARCAPWMDSLLADARAGTGRLSRIDQRTIDAGDIDVPQLNVVGWYEPWVSGALDAFRRSQRRENAPLHRLVIAPMGHIAAPGLPLGEREVPVTWPEEVTLRLPTPFPPEYGNLSQRWMDHWLCDQANGVTEEPPLSIFVLGDNVWRDEYEWPLARTEWTRLFLRSDGRANTAAGDGALVSEPGGGADSDRYVYDPNEPVPTCGNNWLGLCSIQPGMYRQTALLGREDVLFYTGEPLAQRTEVTGPITARLWVSTSAVDTDFIAKLVDVEPDGTAWSVTYGVCRLRAQAGLAVVPNQALEIEVPIAPISYAFQVGHRIRLQITSSDYPVIDRNPNTGASLLVSDEMVVADQAVFHSARSPSQLLLPVIPG